MALADRAVGIDPSVLRIFRREAPVTVLGPGRRAVIWVQGCPFACKGCIVPESWSSQGGELISVADLAEWELAQEDIEGMTFSGGEPMEQADALCALVDVVRSSRDLGLVCYTGYRLETLQRQGSTAQRALLARTDLLIDGVYVAREHAGSDDVVEREALCAQMFREEHHELARFVFDRSIARALPRERNEFLPQPGENLYAHLRVSGLFLVKE